MRMIAVSKELDNEEEADYDLKPVTRMVKKVVILPENKAIQSLSPIEKTRRKNNFTIY